MCFTISDLMDVESETQNVRSTPATLWNAVGDVRRSIHVYIKLMGFNG